MAIKPFSREATIAIVAVIAILVCIRVALPFILKKAINRELSHRLDPYQGRVGDIDLVLISGRYIIKDIEVVKKDVDSGKPFITIEESDLTVDWKSLLKGHFVGEVTMVQPAINFFFAKDYAVTGKETNWVKAVKDLAPIEINTFRISDGSISLTYVDKDLKLESQFEDLNMTVRNIRNVDDVNDALPSDIEATMVAPEYSGKMHLTGKANLLKQIPDVDYDLQFEEIELVALNPLMKHATNMDFESGTLDLYSEMLVQDATLDGYIKPVFTEAMIYRGKEEDRGFFTGIKEFLAEGAQELLERQKSGTTATKIPITGTIKNTDSGFWPALAGMIRHAYWDAILQELDHSVTFRNRKDVNE